MSNGTAFRFLPDAHAVAERVRALASVPVDLEAMLAERDRRLEDFLEDVVAGNGIPTGGTTGQALVKLSNANFDVGWAAVGGGGGIPYHATDAFDSYDYTGVSSGVLMMNVAPLAAGGSPINFVSVSDGDLSMASTGAGGVNINSHGGDVDIESASASGRTGNVIIGATDSITIACGAGAVAPGPILLEAFNGQIIALSTNGQEVLVNGGAAIGACLQLEAFAAGLDPAAPTTVGSHKYGRLYTRDNGAGLIQLCARFPSGPVWVLGTETGPGVAQDSYLDRGNQTGAVTVDYSAARTQRMVMTGNVTLTLSNAVSGFTCSLTLYLVQDGTGSRIVTWPGSVKWPNGLAPVLSTAANAIDIVVLETLDGGTTWFANVAGRAYA